MNERRYTDDEARAILSRAAEMTKADVPAASGLTLAELESTAREAGIDPALVRSAAVNVSRARPDDSGIAMAFGAPLRLIHQHVLPGTLDEAALLRIGEVVLRRLGQATRQDLPRGASWRALTASDAVVVEVRDDGHGNVELRVEDGVGSLAGGLFGGIVGGVGGGVGIPLGVFVGIGVGVLAGIGLALAITAGTWAIVRAGFRRAVAHRDEKLALVVRDVADALGGTPSALASARSAQGVLDAPAREDVVSAPQETPVRVRSR